jgi:hypothetical protein
VIKACRGRRSRAGAGWRRWPSLAAAVLAAGCFALLGAGCRPAPPRAVAAPGDTIAAPGELATDVPAARFDPERGRLLADPARGRRAPYREWTVPVSWKLYDACDEWAAFVDLGRPYGAEPLVLMDVAAGARHQVLDGATGAADGLAITAAQVSRGWLVWEESSVHDIELGAAARWRIMAAPVSRDGTLGRVRVVDRGTVGSRPRCTFRLDGGRVAIGVTEVLRDPVAEPGTALPGARPARGVRGSVVVVDLASGARRVVARFPTGVESVSWSQGPILVVRAAAGAGPRGALVCVLDERTGRRLVDLEMPTGSTALRRPAVSATRLAFSCGEETGDETLARVCVTDIAGRTLGRTVYGGQDPVLVGRSVAYRLMTRMPPGSGPLRGRLVVADPATGRQTQLTDPLSTDAGVWVPVIGARYDPEHLWVYFRSTSGTSEGKEASAPVRRYDLP